MKLKIFIILLITTLTLTGCMDSDDSPKITYSQEPHEFQDDGYQQNCVNRAWNAMGMAIRLHYPAECVSGWWRVSDIKYVWHVQCRWYIEETGRWYWVDQVCDEFVLYEDLPNFSTNEGRVYSIGALELAMDNEWQYDSTPTIRQ